MPLSVEAHGPKGPLMCGKRNGDVRDSLPNPAFPYDKKKWITNKKERNGIAFLSIRGKDYFSILNSFAIFGNPNGSLKKINISLLWASLFQAFSHSSGDYSLLHQHTLLDENYYCSMAFIQVK